MERHDIVDKLRTAYRVKDETTIRVIGLDVSRTLQMLLNGIYLRQLMGRFGICCNNAIYGAVIVER